MKLAIVQVLRKMIAGTYQLDIDGLVNESRGLESKTPKGSDARKKNRYAALFAVLYEQDRQREHGLTEDSDYIAKLYHQSSVHCQMKAVQIAQDDAFAVHGHLKTTVCEAKLSPKILSPPATPTITRQTVPYSIASPHKSHSRRAILSMMS